MADKPKNLQEKKDLTYEEKIYAMGETVIAVMDLYLRNPGKWNERAAINALLADYKELNLDRPTTDLEDAKKFRRGAETWEN